MLTADNTVWLEQNGVKRKIVPGGFLPINCRSGRLFWGAIL